MLYKIKVEGLKKLNESFKNAPRETTEELKNAIKTSVHLIRPMMVRNAPAKTSALRRNIYARSSGLKGEVGPNLEITPYAWFVHEGTKPHIIRPRRKKALYWTGAAHPVRMVKHPGTKANPFVEITADEASGPINSIFKKAVENIVNKLAK